MRDGEAGMAVREFDSILFLGGGAPHAEARLTPDSLCDLSRGRIVEALLAGREDYNLARQVILALLQRGFRLFFVTHLYAFAHGLFERQSSEGLFLRAERLPDGTRTFRLLEDEPLVTSHARDLYRRIFKEEP